MVERAPALLTELGQQAACGPATPTAVEESEADLERVERWLASLQARDDARAPGGVAARPKHSS